MNTNRSLWCACIIVVDPNGSSFNGACKCQCWVDILGQNTGCQTVRGFVWSLNCFLQGFEFQNRQHWTENLQTTHSFDSNGTEWNCSGEFTSSWAMAILSVTFEKTVGSTKKPSLPHFLPPSSNLAPCLVPNSTYLKIFCWLSASICGPCNTSSANGLPTLRVRASSTDSDTNAAISEMLWVKNRILPTKFIWFFTIVNLLVYKCTACSAAALTICKNINQIQ